MRKRLLSLLLLLAIAPALASTNAPCCAQESDCCAHEVATVPVAPDDCCSLNSLDDYVAIAAPLAPQIAPTTMPAPAVRAFATIGSQPPSSAHSTSAPPRFLQFTALRN